MHYRLRKPLPKWLLCNLAGVKLLPIGLAAQDEARHVAFGMAHLREHIVHDSAIVPRLANAVRRCHDALKNTSDLNAEVFHSLLLVASGGWNSSDLRRGHERVMGLLREMDELRQKRMVHLEFDEAEAKEPR